MCVWLEFQSLGPSDVNLSSFVGSQTVSLPKDSQTKVASVSGCIRENWGESSMADASPRTDTSTDDTDEKNQVVMFLSYVAQEAHYYVYNAYPISEIQCLLKVLLNI